MTGTVKRCSHINVRQYEHVTGGEFLRRLKRLARNSRVPVAFDPAHGKGSHGRVWYGARCTTLKDLKKDLGRGLLHDMCADLGVDENDL